MLTLSVLLFLLALLGGTTAATAAGNAPVGGGGSCSYSTEGDGTVGQQQAYDNGLYTCLSASSTWAAEAFMVGSVLQSGSAPTCSSTYAGMLQWTGSALQYCSGSSWTNIGTASTSVTLGTSASATNPQRSGDATTGEFSPATGAWAVSSAGTEMMRVNATGVGIGNTSPPSILTLGTYSGSPQTLSILGSGQTTGAPSGTLTFGNDSASYGFDIVYTNSTGLFSGTASGLWFATRRNSSTQVPRFFIDDSYNLVAIPNNNALSTFVMQGGGTGTTTQLVLTSADATNNNSAILFSSANSTVTTSTISSLKGGIFYNDTGVGFGRGDLIFAQDSVADSSDVTTANALMIIKNSGLIGIGTVTPGNALDVYGSLAIGTYAGTATGASNELIVSGSVGIGTTSPSYLLQVGSSSASGIVMELQNSSGACTYNPGSSSVTVSCSSDARLKNDIVDSKGALAWLEDMRVRDFTWKPTGERRTGVVAQEMIKIHPDMVHTDKDGYYTVDEPNPWKLIKAIQEQQKEVIALKQVIAAQQNEIDDLKRSSSWKGAK